MLMPDVQRAIETCLDAQALPQYLQPVLAPRGAVDAVSIVKAHRSASRHREPYPLRAVYEVTWRETPQAAPQTMRCYGKLYRAGAHGAASAPGALDIEALGLLLWRWPADPALPQLPGLLCAHATLPFWGTAAEAVQAIRYEPECRATLRYTHGLGQALYAKTFADARGHAIQQRFAWFWERSQRDPRAPAVARPLHYDAATHTLWQEAAAGTPLRQCLLRGDGARGERCWHALVQAARAIHAAPAALAGVTVRDDAHWRLEISHRRNKIARALPEQATRAQAVADTLERIAARLPDQPLGLIHGDFHLDQAWFDGHRVVLFDFDEFALGDPMEDLASFIVRLPDDEHGAHAATVCLEAYAACEPQRFCAPRLAWHLAVQQLLQASRAFVFQRADWRGEVRSRLERAEALGQRAESEVLQ